MLTRFKLLWAHVRDSLWFLPGVLTLLCAALAMTLVQLEQAGHINSDNVDSILLGTGAEGARGVLSAIAGGLITVTGVVFSVTIVALQLASSQFTPRVLRNFTADRGNQVVLGVFIATFTYTLLVLRSIRSGGADQDPFVPRIAVAVGVALVLVSIGFLIFFINHAARSIQVSTILARITRDALHDVGRLFPEEIGRVDAVDDLPDPRRPETEGARVLASESGYLQGVDGDSLFQLGEKQGLVIAMEPYVGDFILPGEPLAQVWPPERITGEVVSAIRTAFVLGAERTPEQDLEFGIIELSDIAVKALSPGINDPTTALRCIDRLTEILLALGTRAPPDNRRTREGNVHFIARHLHFERAVGLAFDQIRHYGAENPAIAKKLLAAMSGLAALLPETRHEPLLAQARVLEHAAQSEISIPAERAGVENMAQHTQLRR